MTGDRSTSAGAPTVHWRAAINGFEWPLFASFEPMGRTFASVSLVELPVHGWTATISYRGWERRRVAWFSTRERAQRAVERWAAAHHEKIMAALKAKNTP